MSLRAFRFKAAIALALALASPWALTRPAQAQFFFPFFFDNRPTAHPAPAQPVAPRPHQRPKPRAAEKKPTVPDRAEGKAPAPAPQLDAPPPYQAQLLRLAEIMGALSVLQPLCGGAPDGLRAQMEALMAAENAGPAQRERLAGAFNRGVDGWGGAYRDCTDHARVARTRFEREGAQIAHEISARYRAN